MDLYQEEILDHYKYPRNFGHLDHPSRVFELHNVSCGDKIQMEIVIEGEKIRDIRFSGEGCAISQASASMLTDSIKGQTIQAISKLTTEDILKLLGTTLTPSRVKCATLPLEVLQKLVK